MKRKRKEKKKRSQQKKINKIKNPFNSNIRSEREKRERKGQAKDSNQIACSDVTSDLCGKYQAE